VHCPALTALVELLDCVRGTAGVVKMAQACPSVSYTPIALLVTSTKPGVTSITLTPVKGNAKASSKMRSTLKSLPVHQNSRIMQLERSYRIKRIDFLLVTVATVAAVVCLMAPRSGRADGEARSNLRYQNSPRISRLEIDPSRSNSSIMALAPLTSPWLETLRIALSATLLDHK
jgi:hypothetical protein